MARKKNPAAIAACLPADLEARLLEGMARGVAADAAFRNPLSINVDPIDTSRVLQAVGRLLQRYEIYRDLSEDGGNWGLLYLDMKQCAESVLNELNAAGITGPEPRIYFGRAVWAPDKHIGIDRLVRGVLRLLSPIEQCFEAIRAARGEIATGFKLLNAAAAQSKEPDRPCKPRRRCRLKVKGRQVLLDNEPVPLDMTPERRCVALCYIGHVVRMAGDWISGPDITHTEDAKGTKGLGGRRWERIHAALPKCLRDLIQLKKGAGHRLLPAAWHK
jgi:hypothetical protein